MKDTYIIRRSDGNAVFLWMPAHVQDLLVEVDLVRIGLLTHPLRTTSWAAGWAMPLSCDCRWLASMSCEECAGSMPKLRSWLRARPYAWVGYGGLG